jgi:SepF-like predicted cell division protein (DUF552 family)
MAKSKKSQNWTEEQIKAFEVPTPSDIEAAKVRVRETNPALADLLDAQPKDLEPNK